MNHPEPAQSFEAARRRHLIEATIETLAEVGFKAASLSEIARRANVSTGLFAHYFGDKDGLLEATLRFMAARLSRATAVKLAAATTRRERLFAVCDAALADEEFDRRTSAVWLAFWGQITHSKRYQRVQYIYQRRMITNLRHALRGLVSPDCVEPHAVMIAAMIDGLWLRSHVPDRVTFPGSDGAAARGVVRGLIDGLVAGAAEAMEPAAGPAVPARPIVVPPPDVAVRPIRRLSPATGEPIAQFAPARATEIRRAVQDAQRGFAAWRAVGPVERAEILRHCADLLRAEGPNIARLESLETGRPIAHTAGLDLGDAGRLLERAVRTAEEAADTWTDLGAGRIGRVRHAPVGIVAAAGHWSAAVLDLCRQARPLAQGNAVIHCADAHATETSARLADLFHRSGLPEGVLTLLRGDAESARLLRAHPGLLAASDVARDVAGTDLGAGSACAKACAIVLPGADAVQVAATLFQGGRPWTGSTFAGQSRIYVHADARSDLLEGLRALAGRLQLGSPLDAATQVGPLLSPEHATGIDAALRADSAVGAVSVAGGRIVQDGRTGGAWLQPTVMDGCAETMHLVRGHSFAPIVGLIPFENDCDLVQRLRRWGASDRIGFFTQDPRRAGRISDAVDAAYCVIHDGDMLRASGSQGAVPSLPIEWSATQQGGADFSRSSRVVSGRLGDRGPG